MDTNDFLDQMDPEEKTARPHESEIQPDLSDTEIEVETGPSTPKPKQRSSFSLNPRSWSLAVRFSLVIFLMAVISLSGLSWYTSSTSEQDMITEVGKNFQLQAETLNELTVSFFREKVTQLQALASMDAVTTLTRGKNASYVGNLDEIQDRIAELDELWINAPEGDTFVDSIISPSSWVNALTYQLLDFRESFPENAEIFITDRYGANISATDRTSDYYQADEGWWQASWNGGQGAIYISQPEFDESAGVTGVQISVPIMNSSNTEAIGVVRSTVVLDELFALLDRSFFGETGHSILFDNTGLVIYEPGEMAAEESSDLLAAGVREHFTNSPSHYMTAVDQHGEDALFGHTLLFAAPPSEGSLEGTKYQLESWISNAINDLGWAVVVRQATYESLAAVSQLGYNIGYVNIAIIVLASLMGGYFARSLTQPLTKLSETAEKLGQGNLDARVDIPSDDEVGLVARTINQMADQIQSTLDGLEETISDRTKELRERANEVEASQRVTFAASERTSPEDFLDLLVNLINDQFDVYHTQVYMLDADRQNAVLRESTGYAGRQLLQRGHTLALHKPSLVATSIKENRSVLVPDVTKDPNWASNPLLPLTQSELVVPLRVGDEVIGAIDIQDRVPDRFRQDSVAVFEAMTEHVAFLFENNELLEQITQQSMELETFTNQLRSAADLAEQLSTIRD
ncbi:MAG: HAMP domain-containing protein, partial [Anaerolineae bacterium]|nr:HAMP domain-containing protein [Anaerolineae bacterium]